MLGMKNKSRTHSWSNPAYRTHIYIYIYSWVSKEFSAAAADIAAMLVVNVKYLIGIKRAPVEISVIKALVYFIMFISCELVQANVRLLHLSLALSLSHCRFDLCHILSYYRVPTIYKWTNQPKCHSWCFHHIETERHEMTEIHSLPPFVYDSRSHKVYLLSLYVRMHECIRFHNHGNHSEIWSERAHLSYFSYLFQSFVCSLTF